MNLAYLGPRNEEEVGRSEVGKKEFSAGKMLL